MGSTATFGAPFYGDVVMGRLVYGQSKHEDVYCSKDDYDIPDPETFQTEGSSFRKVKLLNIVMVRRGKCSFTTKVRVAQAKGAHAVIIVDREDSPLTAEKLADIIVADDGFGSNVYIPSVLISKEDGQELISAVSKKTEVVVELAWNLPTDRVVTMDMWMSSGSSQSMQFLKEFAPKRRVLNEVMIFNPHYAVFSMDTNNPDVYSGVCLDKKGADKGVRASQCQDPDGAGDVTGKEVRVTTSCTKLHNSNVIGNTLAAFTGWQVLEEDVRQLCIHEATKAQQSAFAMLPISQFSSQLPSASYNATSMEVSKSGYAEKYWDYMEKYPQRCPVDGTGAKRFGRECSINVMKEVKVNPDEIIQCAMTTQEESCWPVVQSAAWSDQAIRVNGWRFKGIVTADLVVRAVCSGFIHQPPECAQLVEKRDVFRPYIPAPSGGVSFGELLAWLLATVALGFVCMLMYKRYLKKEMRSTLREEVMLEVQAQMGEYAQLRGA
ncbi:BP80 [Symbiodinium pilosum]|uniref:BP80 protein n=1 Tax=Symbiodinium pilosum TaxID=2952 RepID=A0A812LW68_SYMPI|nr:BP80 [Symbiodinium pilosum]